MAYYRRRYRSWRSRGRYWQNKPSKFSVLNSTFGEAVTKIRDEFLQLDDEALEEILEDYEELHGKSAKDYVKKTFSKWKNGTTKLSGQTMERIIELVPPYLNPSSRLKILEFIITHNKPFVPSLHFRIDVENPEQGFIDIDKKLASMNADETLAHLPEKVFNAANWLYDDDITAARAVLAEVTKRENDLIKANAQKEIELFKRAIRSGQVKAATYTVKMPSGNLQITAYKKSICYVATQCFGTESPTTNILRQFRDENLINYDFGRKIIIWYYNNGSKIANYLANKAILKQIVKSFIYLFARIIYYIKGNKI